MSTTSTAVEKIALVVRPVWTYYHQQLCYSIPPKSLQDNIASGTAQQILDAFPHLSRAEAGFLALVADIISGEDPLEVEKAAPKEEDKLGESIRGANLDTTPTPGFREELWGRMLGLLKKVRKRGGTNDQ